MGDQFAHELGAAPDIIDTGIVLGDRTDDLGGERHHLEIVDRKQAGAQAIVDIVRIIGDVVGDRGDLGLQRGKAPQFEVVEPDVVGDSDRHAAIAIPPDRRPAPVGQRAVVLDDAFQRFPGQVEPVEFGIAMFERGQHAQRLGVVIESAMGLQAGIERAFPGVPERRMTEVMGQRQRLREILVQAKLARQCAGNLRYFERMGQPGAVMIALVEHEDLGFMLEAAEGGRMDHPVAIAAKWAAGLARRLVKQSAPAAVGVAGIDRARGSHSDRHGIFCPYPFDSACLRT